MAAKSTWDRVVDSSPIDRTASTVTSSGTHYEPEPTNPCIRWFNECPSFVDHPTAPSFVDLTGRSLGYMTVMGYAGKLNNNKNGMWVCRCVCGRYEYRKSHVIRNPKPTDELNRCSVCNNTLRVRDHGKKSYLTHRKQCA